MNKAISPSYLIVAALSGALFGAGLYVSQMVDPLKVLGFLNFGGIPSGAWDPSLALVIVAAIGVMYIGVKITDKRGAPLFDDQFHLPAFDRLDPALILGAVLFGIGWGMSGLCPGPAITLIAFMPQNLWLFLGMVFVGSFAGHYIQKWMTAQTKAS